MPATAATILKRPALAVGACLFLVAAGCGREEVRVYRVPKSTAPAAPALASAPPATGQPAIHWDVPSNWTNKPPGAMRVGSFGVTGSPIDISVIPLPGESGSDLDNVNRWRGQLNLPPVDAAALATLGDAVEVEGVSARLYDFAGTPKDKTAAERMLVSAVSVSGTAWFFKMVGPDAAVAAEKPAFLAFLKSVHFHADGDTSHAEPAASEAPQSSWKIPASWTEVAPGAMQQAKFVAKGNGAAQADVTLSVFPGEAGGLLPNVNRWRGQLQLAPITEGELAKLVSESPSPSGPITVLDMKNETSGQRMLAAIAKRGSSTWYFKFMGDSGIIDRERDAFLRFAGQPQ